MASNPFGKLIDRILLACDTVDVIALNQQTLWAQITRLEGALVTDKDKDPNVSDYTEDVPDPNAENTSDSEATDENETRDPGGQAVTPTSDNDTADTPVIGGSTEDGVPPGND